MCTNVHLKIYALLQLAAKFKSNVKYDSKYEAVEKTLCERGNDKWHGKIASRGNTLLVVLMGLCLSLLHSCEKHRTKEIITLSGNEWQKKRTQIMTKIYEKSATEVVSNLAKELKKTCSPFICCFLATKSVLAAFKEGALPLGHSSHGLLRELLMCEPKRSPECPLGPQQYNNTPWCILLQISNENCYIIQESLIFLSDDLVHDAHAVATFFAKANEHLQNKRGLIIEKFSVLMDVLCSINSKPPLQIAHTERTTMVLLLKDTSTVQPWKRALQWCQFHCKVRSKKSSYGHKSCH